MKMMWMSEFLWNTGVERPCFESSKASIHKLAQQNKNWMIKLLDNSVKMQAISDAKHKKLTGKQYGKIMLQTKPV